MSHATEPTLNQRDVRLLSVLVSLVADEVEAATAADEQHQALRERITRVIRETSFEMVFQPIIALRSGRAAGYEALSRFTAQSAQTPDVWFADAAAAGLRAELELAAAAVRQLSKLPALTFMAINCSPDTISHPQLHRLLAEVDPRRIVLELTEHLQIDDYRTLRRSIGQLRKKTGVRLAVDDAGAGYASLRPSFSWRLTSSRSTSLSFAASIGIPHVGHWCLHWRTSPVRPARSSWPKESRSRRSSKLCAACGSRSARATCSAARVLSRAHSISGGRKRPRRFPFSRAAGRVPERSDQQALRTH